MMMMKNRVRMMFGLTFIMLAFPGLGEPPQVWSRLTQPPYPYLRPSNQCNFFLQNCCTPFFEIWPVLGQDVIVDVQLFLFHPSALLMACDAEREVVVVSRSCCCIVFFSNLVSGKITICKCKSPRNCTDNWSFAGTNKILHLMVM